MSGPVLFQRAKSGGATVKATVSEYRGSRFLDIREWVERDGAPLPTQKGVTMPLEAMRALGEALIAASHANGSGEPPTGFQGHIEGRPETAAPPFSASNLKLTTHARPQDIRQPPSH